tara:strand:+ start:71 stop:367 length:297 start_codon:yes stop_codon:yes gene_type:complete
MSNEKPITGIYKSYNQLTKKESFIKIIDWHEVDAGEGWQATVDPAFCDANDVMFEIDEKPYQHSGDQTGFMFPNVTGPVDFTMYAFETMHDCVLLTLQ